MCHGWPWCYFVCLLCGSISLCHATWCVMRESTIIQCPQIGIAAVGCGKEEPGTRLILLFIVNYRRNQTGVAMAQVGC